MLVDSSLRTVVSRLSVYNIPLSIDISNIPDAGRLTLENKDNKAVEAEIVIVIGRDIKSSGVTTADILRATEGITGMVELVNCRIKDWKMTRSEAIADNAFHAGIILGSSMRIPGDIDLPMEGVVLSKNGNLLASACGIEALGNPLNVVVWLADKLASRGKILKEGDVVSTGSLTEFFFVQPGDVVDVAFAHLESIGFAVGE